MIILLFSLVINFRITKRLSKIPWHVLQPQFQCVPLCHDGTHNHRHTICLLASRGGDGCRMKHMVCREGLDRQG